MERTEGYWHAPCSILEKAGLPVFVVNPSHIKRRIGCTADMSDAKWLARVGRSSLFYQPTFFQKIGRFFCQKLKFHQRQGISIRKPQGVPQQKTWQQHRSRRHGCLRRELVRKYT
mgnify:CR=1 FL=1